ncbi:MAG: hypothetical protein Q7K43_04730 [Candidatus Woesearchaeota archaeon]|nr:hypothetical protein [Candidatus Woesearchaeota archaeon]
MVASIVLIPSLLLGLVIGIYEAILVHRDVTVPLHRFAHTIHAVFFAVIATFASMNVPFVLGLLSSIDLPSWLLSPLVFRIAIGLIAVIKIHGVSAAIQGSVGISSVGLAEKWTHSLLIGALIVLAPYVYPFIAPLLPLWAQN